MLKHRVITALVMLVVFAGMVFFASPKWWFIGMLLLMAWAAAEWTRLAGINTEWQRAVYIMLTPVLLTAIWLWVGRGNTAAGLHTLVMILLASIAFWMMFVPIWLWRGWQLRQPALMALVGWWVLIPAGVCFLYLRPTGEDGWLLTGLLAVVWIADIAAYFTGRAFGRHKLAPSISPGKTLEGALGAWLGVTLYLVAMTKWFAVDGFANWQLSLGAVLFAAFFLTYQSILGDLFESWLKRCAGIKDSGSSLPGHGGILDRIDAILPVLPLQVMLLFYFGRS